jgi:hypothetical protein
MAGRGGDVDPEAEHVDPGADAGHPDEHRLEEVPDHPPRLRQDRVPEGAVRDLRELHHARARPQVRFEPVDERLVHQEHVPGAPGLELVGGEEAVVQEPLAEGVHRAGALEVLADDLLRVRVEPAGEGADGDEVLSARSARVTASSASGPVKYPPASTTRLLVLRERLAGGGLRGGRVHHARAR